MLYTWGFYINDLRHIHSIASRIVQSLLWNINILEGKEIMGMKRNSKKVYDFTSNYWLMIRSPVTKLPFLESSHSMLHEACDIIDDSVFSARLV
jgi:hypothetical protein